MREKPENRHLKSLTLKEFTGLIFEKVSMLHRVLLLVTLSSAAARSLSLPPLLCVPGAWAEALPQQFGGDLCQL